MRACNRSNHNFKCGTEEVLTEVAKSKSTTPTQLLGKKKKTFRHSQCTTPTYDRKKWRTTSAGALDKSKPYSEEHSESLKANGETIQSHTQLRCPKKQRPQRTEALRPENKLNGREKWGLQQKKVIMNRSPDKIHERLTETTQCEVEWDWCQAHDETVTG